MTTHDHLTALIAREAAIDQRQNEILEAYGDAPPDLQAALADETMALDAELHVVRARREQLAAQGPRP